MLGIGAGLRFSASPAGRLPPELPAVQPLPIAASARWHPQFSTVATSGGRVVTATDLQGLAGVSEITPGAGPRSLTDGLGRAFWRFEGGQALTAASDLVINQAAFAVFMVVRAHRVLTKNPFFDIGTQAGGDASNCLIASVQGRGPSNLRTFSNYPRNSTTPGSEHTVAGSQLQVIGIASRSNAAGKQAIFHNANRLDVDRSAASSVKTGAMIGYGPGSNGGQFDLYDIAVYTEELTNGQCAEITAALQAGWNIPDVTNQLVLEGDSITQGTGPVTPALNCAMVLTEPGSNHVPAGWRVLNYGTSGNAVPDLIIRRDGAGEGGWPLLRLSGQNVMAFEIGRNDFGAGGQTAAQHYANVVEYLNTPVDGILQHGWIVRAMANIASSPNHMQKFEDFRSAMRDPQFLVDTLTGSGQAYAGKLSVVSTDLIEHNGKTRFLDASDAADTAYYAGDSTHPSILGAEIRVTGGDTPEYGVAAGL